MNIKQTLLRILGTLGKFLSVLFADAVKKELEVVMPIAIKAVYAVAADPTLLSNAEKRDTAISLITADLLNSQKQVGASIIELGVQLAVQQMKAATR